jgi:hypothetical protein
MTGADGFFDALRKAGLETRILALPSGARAVAVPALAGRLFLVRGERVAHRFDAAQVLSPSRETGVYNNYGGLNVWPAPEGGEFGWTYTRDGKWHVQDGVNAEPFRVSAAAEGALVLERTSTIVNRKGTALRVGWRREAEFQGVPDAGPGVEGCLLRVTDSLACDPSADALIAPWTLEQFDASPDTESFCVVADPRGAINFDYYEHPGDRIRYHGGHFLYRTDGAKAGQIGVRAASRPRAIGMLDRANGFLAVRTVCGDVTAPRYFNMADNDQPRGPWSAADAYSIFNSPAHLSFLELETVGGCAPRGGAYAPLPLVSETRYFFGGPGDLIRLIEERFAVRYGA